MSKIQNVSIILENDGRPSTQFWFLLFASFCTHSAQIAWMSTICGHVIQLRVNSLKNLFIWSVRDGWIANQRIRYISGENGIERERVSKLNKTMVISILNFSPFHFVCECERIFFMFCTFSVCSSISYQRWFHLCFLFSRLFELESFDYGKFNFGSIFFVLST